MTHQDKKVLACVDLSPQAEPVADYAAWAATRLAAPMELLHIIERHPALTGQQDHSGALGAQAEAHLLKALSEADATRTRTEREQARVFLNALRLRAEAAGARTVDTRQRHGDLTETLSEQQADVRLLVLGARGASGQGTPQGLGRHVAWTVRTLQRPILAVTGPFKRPERVLIAFDGSAITRQGVAMVAASPLFKGLPVQVLMAGKPHSDAAAALEWARQTLAQAGFEVSVGSEPGAPELVIHHAVERQGIDLLIMGAYTHSPLRQLFLGSQTTALLKAARVPTLLLR
ncbi:MAG: universal stress protein [Ideonella sp.]|nr:universal stress protein [Ideonella sp.]